MPGKLLVLPRAQHPLQLQDKQDHRHSALVRCKPRGKTTTIRSPEGGWYSAVRRRSALFSPPWNPQTQARKGPHGGWGMPLCGGTSLSLRDVGATQLHWKVSHGTEWRCGPWSHPTARQREGPTPSLSHVLSGLSPPQAADRGLRVLCDCDMASTLFLSSQRGSCFHREGEQGSRGGGAGWKPPSFAV